MRRPSLTTTVPLPRDSPILRRDTTSYDPSSRIVRSMYSGSDPDPYSTPCHVPATDPMLDTVTGVIGPRLAQPTSEIANPTRTAAARVAQGDRAPLNFIASLLLLRTTKAVTVGRNCLVAWALRWPTITASRSPPGTGSPC